FTLPASNVAVTAVFAKTQAAKDAEAVADAKALIESSYFDVTQATANTEAELKAWLVARINAIVGVTVSAADITISGFHAATEGVWGNVWGTDGGFTFTVKLSQGASRATTAPVDGVIYATPAPTGTEEVAAGALTVTPTDGGLLVRGIVIGEQLSVYNLRGQLLYNVKATSTEQRIDLRERGIYVIVSGENSVKAVY
ncbi:MAG: DUF6383 domain-containing protein, partial [Tannerella sp.]|nr:DUF6383 domain-containing protein [Tannerella sp.]